MTESKSTSTGHSSSGSELTGLSTDQTPTSNAQTTSSASKSNPQSTQPDDELTDIFKRMRDIIDEHNVELPFMAHYDLLQLLYDAYKVGFNEYKRIMQTVEKMNGRWM